MVNSVDLLEFNMQMDFMLKIFVNTHGVNQRKLNLNSTVLHSL